MFKNEQKAQLVGRVHIRHDAHVGYFSRLASAVSRPGYVFRHT